MIHIQYKGSEENIGIGVGDYVDNNEDQLAIKGMSVPEGFKVTFYDKADKSGWKSYPFYEGVYPELFVYNIPERPALISVQTVEFTAKDLVKFDNVYHVIEDENNNVVMKYPAFTGRQVKIKKALGQRRREINAFFKLPPREGPYFGERDFLNDAIDSLLVPHGITVEVYKDIGNENNFAEKTIKRGGGTRTIANHFYTFHGKNEGGTFHDLRRKQMQNRTSMLRINRSEFFVEEDARQEEERIEGKIIPIVQKFNNEMVSCLEVKTGKWTDKGAEIEWDFGLVEHDYHDWHRSTEGSAWHGLSFYARNGAIIAAHIMGEQVHAFRKRGFRDPNIDSSFRPAITIELKDGKKTNVENYTDVVFHEVTPLRGIYYIYDWIEWLKIDPETKEETLIYKANVADIKRIYPIKTD